MATINGTGRADILFGGDDDDFVFGFAGNDQLYLGAGFDLADAGDGNDVVDGGNKAAGFRTSNEFTDGTYSTVMYLGDGQDVGHIGDGMYCNPGIRGGIDDHDRDTIVFHDRPGGYRLFAKVNQLGDEDRMRLPNGAEPDIRPLVTSDADGDGNRELKGFTFDGIRGIKAKVVFAETHEYANGTDIEASLVDDFFI